jgi:hypothetical protein
LTPAVALFAVLAGLELRRTRALGASAICALVLLLAGWPLADAGGIGRAIGVPLRFDQVHDRLDELRLAEVNRQEVLRRAALRRGVTSRLASVRGGLGGGALAVVPWENHLAIALGAHPSGAILQAYAAHTPEAQARWLDALRAAPSAEVLLAVDHLGTRPIDGVLTTARLPGILRGLLEEFEPAAQPASGAPFLLLRRRSSPRSLRVTQVGVESRASGGTDVSDLELAPVPCRLAALELELAYPPWVALGRPEQIELEVSLGGGAMVSSRVVPLRAGTPFEILVPLVSFDAFAELWSAPIAPPPELKAIRLRRAPETLAAAPSRREVRGVSCLDW